MADSESDLREPTEEELRILDEYIDLLTAGKDTDINKFVVGRCTPGNERTMIGLLRTARKMRTMASVIANAVSEDEIEQLKKKSKEKLLEAMYGETT